MLLWTQAALQSNASIGDDDDSVSDVSSSTASQQQQQQQQQQQVATREVPTASEFVDGMAFHWYQGSNDRELDGTYGYNAIRAAHNIAPDMIMLATEGCSCPGIEVPILMCYFSFQC